MKKRKQNKERRIDTKSNKRCKVAQRFSHGTVRTKFVNRNKDTVIVDIENFVNLPHMTGIHISNIQACGHPWKLNVYPLACDSRTNPSGRSVDTFLIYDGERTKTNPVIVNVRFRGKTAIKSLWEKQSCRKTDVGYSLFTLQRHQVVGNELNKDGTFTFEIDIEIAKRAVSQPVWYPKLNESNNDIGTTRYRSIEATPDVTFLVGQPKKVITEEQSSSLSENDTAIILPKDHNDPTYVTDYVDDMYEHYRYKEETTIVDRKQPHINESARCFLVDWLVEVHYSLKLFPETLYLTVNLLDRFLSESKESITQRDLQLVGMTALHISIKYEEGFVLKLQELTYMCGGDFTEAKILCMEEKILQTLAYNVTVPTPYTFLVRFLKAANAEKLTSQIANFVLDGTLLTLEHLTCLWRPSQLAAAAVFIARRAVGDEGGGGGRMTPHTHHWSSKLSKYTLYDVKEVVPVAQSILNAKKELDRNKRLLAVQKKYSITKYGKVSYYKFNPIEDEVSMKPKEKKAASKKKKASKRYKN